MNKFKYKISRTLGRGAYGTVYMATVESDAFGLKKGDVVAIKAVSKSRITNEKEEQSLKEEIELMQAMNHRHIVKLYTVERTKSHYLMVMEYCNAGDLQGLIRQNPNGLSEDVTKDITKQIALGLAYLHSLNIVHRDLKPLNIMLTKTAENETICKIADFGFARFLKPADLAETVCGSPMYMAPEIQFSHPYSANVDMWSMGVMIYMMVTGEYPFPNVRSQGELAIELHNRGDQPFYLPLDAVASPELRDLVSRLLVVDPSCRLSFEDFITHPFFSGLISLPNSPLIDTIDDIPNTKKKNKKKRIPKFSFLAAIPELDKQQAEDILKEAYNSAEVIFSYFDQLKKQNIGMLFYISLMLNEYLVDFLLEERKINDTYPRIEGMIIELMYKITGIINEIKDVEPDPQYLVDPKSCPKFLYQEAIKFAKEGIKHEQESEFEEACQKYQKAIYIVQPLAFTLTSNSYIKNVRTFYRGLIDRMENLQTFV